MNRHERRAATKLPQKRTPGDTPLSGSGTFRKILESNPPLTPQDLRRQRIDLIQKIQMTRGRPLVIYATKFGSSVPGVPAYIHREDIVPLVEVLDSVSGDKIDILLETPGGLAEVTIEIVNLLRPRFRHVGFIIPHMAMSAGTILTMSGDDILMDHRSSLGPIDPQFEGIDGRPQPAQAILSGIETIKGEVQKNNGILHPVYVPILRNVDPGRLQSATNASELSRRLVTEWLTQYKFQDWTTHSSTSQPVTDEDRKRRAEEIAKELCDHQKWLSHGRPIKLADLNRMRLKITDYGQSAELQAAIWSLWVNLHHLLSATNFYKVYESEAGEFYKGAIAPPLGVQPQRAAVPAKAIANVQCNKCGSNYKVQCNFGAAQPIEAGAMPFPKNSSFNCKNCGTLLELSGMKLALEAQMGQPLIA